MGRLNLMWWKVRRWFRLPRLGWKQLVRQYLRGRRVWEVPGKLDVPKLLGFPLEWVPHEMSDSASGFDLVAIVCTDSGVEVPPGVAVCCARCGVSLHPDCANMKAMMDVPACKRCRWLVSRV